MVSSVITHIDLAKELFSIVFCSKSRELSYRSRSGSISRLRLIVLYDWRTGFRNIVLFLEIKFDILSPLSFEKKCDSESNITIDPDFILSNRSESGFLDVVGWFFMSTILISSKWCPLRLSFDKLKFCIVDTKSL